MKGKAGAIRSAGRLVPGYSDKLRYTAPGHRRGSSETSSERLNHDNLVRIILVVSLRYYA